MDSRLSKRTSYMFHVKLPLARSDDPTRDEVLLSLMTKLGSIWKMAKENKYPRRQ